MKLSSIHCLNEPIKHWLYTFMNLLFYTSIIVDLINGYLQLKLNINTPIGQLFRLTIISFLIFFLLKKSLNKITKYAIIWVLLWFINCIIWVLSYSIYDISFSISIEINDMIRIVYTLLMIGFFIKYYDYYGTSSLLKIVQNYGALIALCIIFSFITGFGQYSYGENYGFGTKSWFIAGNDIGITMIFTLIASSVNLFRSFSSYNLLSYLTIFIGSLLVGSRVCIFGASYTIVSTIIYFIFFFTPKKQDKIKYYISLILLLPLIIYGCIIFVSLIYSLLDNYALARLSIESIGSARDNLTLTTTKYIESLNGLSLLIGRGASECYNYIATHIGYDTPFKSTEADIYDLIGSYGFLFGLFTLLPFFHWTLKSIVKYLKNRTYINYNSCLICILFLAIGSLSGHCIRNNMVAPIYAIFIGMLYHNNQT